MHWNPFDRQVATRVQMEMQTENGTITFQLMPLCSFLHLQFTSHSDSASGLSRCANSASLIYQLMESVYSFSQLLHILVPGPSELVLTKSYSLNPFAGVLVERK